MTVMMMLQRALTVDSFFSAYPSVLHCLTKLSLYNVCFAEWDLHHILFDWCKQLRHLSLFNCDAGGPSAWEIQAPDSKLTVLELDFCCLRRLEVLCLPKLERLRWDTWISPKRPLSLDVVPSLEEVNLICGATVDHQGFMLSEVLRDITAIHNLTLNFQGDKVNLYSFSCTIYFIFNVALQLVDFIIFYIVILIKYQEVDDLEHNLKNIVIK